MKDKYDTTQISSLVRPDCVHRDVYIDPEIFRLEIKRIFARSWNYLCHESQLSDPGDYLTTEIAGNPVIVIRHEDSTIKVLHNRCAHRAARVLENTQGNARVLNCIYHGWRYTTDGELLSIPCRDNYRNTDVENNQAHYRLPEIRS
ncbi:MAG: Rieske 2Fe-2S domain-containing protein, partial [Gammaproteobacteria bacterium]|nr:Rieske 2Fe-2S domain-containing protein [Gammaproteobacteria bacterium]